MDLMNYKIETWHTLSEYKKKYGRCNKLIELTRKEINDFDRKNNVNTENYLLQGKKWWLINGKYYEVPRHDKKLSGLGFSLLGLLLTTGITLGVGQGVFHWFNGDGGGDTPTPGPVPPVPPVTDVTLTFDPGDGAFPGKVAKEKITKVVEYGTTWDQVTDKPGTPELTGKTFTKFTINDKEITSTYVFKKDTTLVANYETATFTITFKSGTSGTFKDKSTSKTATKIEYGSSLKDVADKIEKPDGETVLFKSWQVDGKDISDTDKVTKSIEVEASYDAAVTITFDANGGNFPESNKNTSDVKIKSTTKWSEVTKPEPTRTDYELKRWYMNEDEGAIIDSDTTFSANTTVKAYWYQPSKEDAFTKATWYEIIDTAEKSGFKGLADKYLAGVESPTFVGKEKTVLVTDDAESNGVREYKVKVVDEQADEITETGTNNHAVLTFEFEDVLNVDDVSFNSKETGYNNKWNDKDSIRTSLQDDGDIFKKIIEPLDNDEHKDELLTSKMLETKKKTNSSGTKTTNDKLFLPSLSELGVKKIPSTYVDVDDEGTVYKNYNGDNKSYIKKKKGAANGYWLRSDDADDEKKVWYVDKNGKIGGESSKSVDAKDTKLGVAPCFCIGKTSNATKVTYSLGTSGAKFSDKSGDSKKEFNTVKNTTYTAFKKGINFPTVTKDSTDTTYYEFKYWYYNDNSDGEVEITDDYLLQDYNLILYPKFEEKDKSFNPGISLELINDEEHPEKKNPVKVTFTTEITESTKKPNLWYRTNKDTEYTKVDWTKSEDDRTVIIDSNKSKLIISSNTESNTGLSQNDNLYTKIKVDEVKNEEYKDGGGRVSLSGDLRTLIKASDYQSVNSATDYCFYNLFGGAYSGDNLPGAEINPIKITETHTGIEDASNLKLGVTTTGEASFKKMFQCNENLIYAPKVLEPTNLNGNNTYFGCFGCCTSLLEAPTLPDISKIGTWTYYKMFHYCTSLEVGPKLYSSTLDDWAYGSMFKYCIKLKTASELPDNMEFIDGSTEQLCGMFFGCESLLLAPKKISAKKLTNASCRDMFADCKKLIIGPEIYAEEVYVPTSETDKTKGSLCQMFNGCAALEYVKVYYDDITKIPLACNNWMNDVPSESKCVFECPSSTTVGTRSVNGIPSGWTPKTFEEPKS